MRNYNFIRLTSEIVNMTGRTIRLYEETTGEIRRFPVSRETLPGHPIRTEEGYISVHYVYEEEDAERIKNSERELDDIAVIVERAVGRGGREIDYLVLAEDMKTPVVLYDYASGM